MLNCVLMRALGLRALEPSVRERSRAALERCLASAHERRSSAHGRRSSAHERRSSAHERCSGAMIAHEQRSSAHERPSSATSAHLLCPRAVCVRSTRARVAFGHTGLWDILIYNILIISDAKPSVFSTRRRFLLIPVSFIVIVIK